MIYIVMGVSGCGKSSVGRLLAQTLDIDFFDADDFHPQSNIDKMASGLALNDDDRWPWLEKLNRQMRAWQKGKGAVLACSALKEKYRALLALGLPSAVQFIYLQGDFDTLLQRLNGRQGHFMKSDLLHSQLATLEVPSDAITVDINQTLDAIVEQIIREI